MAIFHLSAQVISRSTGRSSVAAAAYRAGEKLTDDRTGLVHDYSRRRGEIDMAILAPEGAPEWATNRSQLWNAVEAKEKRVGQDGIDRSTVAREINVALPKELSPEQQRELVLGYVREQFVEKHGLVADVAIHRMDKGNPHAHIMLTTRALKEDGTFGNKVRDLDPIARQRAKLPPLVEEWRAKWSDHANRALERAGEAARIDHRSLKAQGQTERLPQIHMGPHVAAMEKKGIPTERGDRLRFINQVNGVVIDLQKAREEREQLKAEKSAERVIAERFAERVKLGWTPANAKAAANLEREELGLRPATIPELRLMQDAAYWEQRQLQTQIQRIEQQSQQAERASSIWSEREARREALSELERPGARVKRLVSPVARAEYANAQERFRTADRAARSTGVTGAAEAARQREEAARERTRLRPLQTRLGEVNQGLSVINQALQGFAEQMREDERRRQAMEHGRLQDGRSRDGRGRDR